MNKKKKLAKKLLTFIENSPTSFHATKNIKNKLESNNFKKLKEDEKWDLNPGNKYYLERNNSALIAFTYGKNNIENGFNLIGAHTDSPLLKIKNEAVIKKHNYIKIGTEVYGGPIVHTWLDKELSIAGRVTVEEGGEIKSKLVNFEEPVAIIPNLAIHMNRKVNKGFEYNKQKHLPAIISTVNNEDDNSNNNKNFLKQLIADKINTKYESIYELDLFLYDITSPKVTGIENEFVTAGRLDDLAMCHSILEALTNKDRYEATNIGIFYDNEEIGSRTYQGANSNFLRDTLERLIITEGGDRQDYFRAIANSFLISADQAHALHPNFSDKHDSNYAPVINKGPVVKLNANFRYATTSETASYFEKLCKDANVPFQRLANRSDMKSGSTIGPMTSSLLNVKTVDVGNPLWAMHSVRETGGVKDHFYMTEIFKKFFK
ncbi:MAG: M18 family aminopeptidase [Candidatus Mcinerneyibacterium aminivorans]|uniref:M18 family aminopeptidase n=1 Tax=Candidatus Mcinerneyibacterium aminivorans TaxID=2703815 RepID=A0A5D0MKD7_9BACT|nr:MAG: M18 family aminopeptidase [Candidatus Mcinerneyibacterium aminivorans]